MDATSVTSFSVCPYRGVPGKVNINCSFEQPISTKVLLRNALSGLAASFVLLSQTNQVCALLL